MPDPTGIARLRLFLRRLDAYLLKFEPKVQPTEVIPPPGRQQEIIHFIRSVDYATEGARAYTEFHLPRLARTLGLVPAPRSGGRVLELGAYVETTATLACVLGYQDVRGAFYGPPGRVDEKTVTVGGEPVFQCLIDHFDAERHAYPYPDGYFECVLACEILEHLLSDPMHMLVECHRVLEEGGRLLLTTPNIASNTAVVRMLLRNDNPQVYSKYPDPRNPNRDSEIPHVREYTPKEVRDAVECAGFEVELLFTEMVVGHEPFLWAKDVLDRNGFSSEFRGQQIYCLARKRSDLSVTRYPWFLYDGISESGEKK